MTPQPNRSPAPPRHAAHLPDEGPADAPDAAALATDEPPCVDEALGDAGQLGPPGSSRGVAAPSKAPSSSQPQGQAPAPPCAASRPRAPGACRPPCAAPALQAHARASSPRRTALHGCPQLLCATLT
jgi:hypothetical protein